MAYDSRLKAAPPGPLRNMRVIAIDANDDFTRAEGFICQAVEAGSVVFRPLLGDADITQTVAAGQVIGVGSHPVLLSAVRSVAGGTRAGSIVIGTL